MRSAKLNQEATSSHAQPAVSVESIENVINSMKLGKACGPGNLSVEHLKYSHVVLLIHSKLLFSS
jgi:hypothetical protein